MSAVVTPWAVVASPTDAEMYAVRGAYLVADFLPLEDARLIASAPKLLNALSRLLGKFPDENLGWRAFTSSDPALFQCEFCRDEHLDCTKIPHREDCPVAEARAAIAKATGQEGGAL